MRIIKGKGLLEVNDRDSIKGVLFKGGFIRGKGLLTKLQYLEKLQLQSTSA